jgi:hypothetical protein
MSGQEDVAAQRQQFQVQKVIKKCGHKNDTQLHWETTMLLVEFIDIAVGMLCGLWFSLFVLVPLVSVAIIEVVLLTTTWTSAFWWCGVLITSLEMGYLMGCALGTMWLHIGGRGFRRDFMAPGHGRLSRH